MPKNQQSPTSLHMAVACISAIVPFACARGVDNVFDEPANAGGAMSGAAGSLVVVGTGEPSTGSGGAGGSGSSATTVGVGTSTVVGAGGGAGDTVGIGGGAGMGGAGGGAGSTVGAGTGGVGGGAGMGGAAAKDSGATDGARGGAGASAGDGQAGNGGSQGGSGGNASDAGNPDGSGSAGNGGNGGAGGQPPRPTNVILAQPAVSSGILSSSARGDAFTQSCMPNEVVIGYTGTVDAPGSALTQLRTFRAVCGSLAVTGTTTFAVTTTTAESLAVIGTMPGPTQLTEMCASNQMVVGFGGRSNADIDQITFVCAPLIISGTAPNYSLSLGTMTTLPGLGGPGGNPFTPIQCPAGQIAVGNEGRAAITTNAFGLLCEAPTLVVQ